MGDLIGWIIVVELALMIFGISSLKNAQTHNRLEELLGSIEKTARDIGEDLNQHHQRIEAKLQSIEYNLSLLKEHALPSNLLRK